MRFSDLDEFERDLGDLFDDVRPQKQNKTMLTNSEIRKAMTAGLEISEKESELAKSREDYLSVPN